MKKYEIWERRPGGTWRSVADAPSLRDAHEYIWRRLRTGKSLHFAKAGPSEYVALLVGDMPHADTEPYVVSAK